MRGICVWVCVCAGMCRYKSLCIYSMAYVCNSGDNSKELVLPFCHGDYGD